MSADSKNQHVNFKDIFAGAVFAGALVWAAHFEISRINDRLDALDKHISRVETAVRIIGAKQGGDTKTLVDEALTVAKNAADAGRIDSAETALGVANHLIEEQTKLKIGASPQFFQTATNTLSGVVKTSNPSVKTAAFSVQGKLAEYRSALLPIPSVIGIGMDCSSIPGVSAYSNPLGGFQVISKGSVRNCFQRLDSFGWVDMVFIDSKILYGGGPLMLKNVRFVHCTFQVEGQDEPSLQFLQYAALDQAEFSYKPPTA